MSRFPLVTNHLNPNASWGSGEKAVACSRPMAKSLNSSGGRTHAPSGRSSTVMTATVPLSGFHFVNRIGYLISTVPLPEGMDVEVNLPRERTGAAETDEAGEA